MVSQLPGQPHFGGGLVQTKREGVRQESNIYSHHVVSRALRS